LFLKLLLTTKTGIQHILCVGLTKVTQEVMLKFPCFSVIHRGFGPSLRWVSKEEGRDSVVERADGGRTWLAKDVCVRIEFHKIPLDELVWVISWVTGVSVGAKPAQPIVNL
jgi:hypothetical protein